MAEKLTDAQKCNYIKQKYGEKAEVMLRTYGAMAYDIDKNFNKFYNEKIPFGRNNWMTQKETWERTSLGYKNQKLFEEGKLPIAEAARIVNCPMFFGSLHSTILKYSEQIRQSGAAYRAAHEPAPEPVLAEVKTQPKKEQTVQPKKEKAKETPKRTTVKKELRTQRQVADKVAELKPVMLEEVVVTAKAPEKKPGLALLDAKLAEFDASKIKLDIKIKSPAERKYDELLAKKTADMPDEMMGRKGTEIGLTIGELMKLGVDPKDDFQTILKNMGEKDKAAAEKLIPAEGFGDKKVVVSKELAIAAIERAQAREISKRRGKERA